MPVAHWQAVRDTIPALAGRVYLNTGTLGPSPRAVTDAYLSAVREWQAAGPGEPDTYHRWQGRMEAARAALARHFGVAPDEVAFTANATDGVNIALWGLDWRPGDELVISDEEHPAVFVPAYWLRDRLGVNVRVLRLREPGGYDPAGILDRLEKLLSPRTRMVCLSHATSDTGALLPAGEVVRRVRAAGALAVLDGAQTAGQLPVDLGALAADAYAVNGHKWLLAPVGTGAVIIRREAQERIRPSWTGGGAAALRPAGRGSSRRDELELEWSAGARRYEFGSRDWALGAGWEAALALADGLGWDVVRGRGLALAARLRAALAGVPAVEPVSPAEPEQATGIFTVATPGRDPEAVYRSLRARGVVTRPTRGTRLGGSPPGIRFCCAWFNTEAEVDAAAAAFREALAAAPGAPTEGRVPTGGGCGGYPAGA